MVPTTAKREMLPRLLKKFPLLRLYPDSKMMGGGGRPPIPIPRPVGPEGPWLMGRRVRHYKRGVCESSGLPPRPLITAPTLILGLSTVPRVPTLAPDPRE